MVSETFCFKKRQPVAHITFLCNRRYQIRFIVMLAKFFLVGIEKDGGIETRPSSSNSPFKLKYSNTGCMHRQDPRLNEEGGWSWRIGGRVFVLYLICIVCSTFCSSWKSYTGINHGEDAGPPHKSCSIDRYVKEPQNRLGDKHWVVVLWMA